MIEPASKKTARRKTIFRAFCPRCERGPFTTTKAGRIRKHVCYERAKKSECTLVPEGPPPRHKMPTEWTSKLDWEPVLSPGAKKGLVVTAFVFTSVLAAWAISKHKTATAAAATLP